MLLNMFNIENNSMVMILLCLFIATTFSDNNDIHVLENVTRSDHVDRNPVVNITAVKSHLGREHVIESPNQKALTTTNNSTLKKPDGVKPVFENIIPDIAPRQDDGKPSVPKKGVSFSDLENAPNVTGNVDTKPKSNKIETSHNGIDNNLKKIFNITNNAKNVPSNQSSSHKQHKKPLVTESDTDYIDISNDKNKSKEVITADQIDPLITQKQPKRADYIVPIVAVILSVPLVAILLSFVYKRSADWWQHRNYKRMDFLIEGMYHN